MSVMSKIGRLFVVKTRFEAWLVIYAIAMGAVERGRHYLDLYPGWGGWSLALACTGVVFVAGAKLLDSVRPAAPELARASYSGPNRRRHIATRMSSTRLALRRGSDFGRARRED